MAKHAVFWHESMPVKYEKSRERTAQINRARGDEATWDGVLLEAAYAVLSVNDIDRMTEALTDLGRVAREMRKDVEALAEIFAQQLEDEEAIDDSEDDE